MKEFITQSVYFGVVISFIGYEIGLFLKKKWKMALFNPLLIAAVFVIGVLLLFDVDYETYHNGAKYISYFLTPATVSLAVPLYRQLAILKKYPLAVLGGIASGVLTTMVCIYLLALGLQLSHEQYVTLLPKSITTAIGMGISEKTGGIVTITVVAICITGIVGNMLAETVLKLFQIKNPIAKGIAIGTSAHALGTAKAMEMGEVEGAMSSLAIVVSGIMTVVSISLFSKLL